MPQAVATSLLVTTLGALALLATTSDAKAAPEPNVVAGYDPDIGAFIRTPDRRWELNPYAMVQLTFATTGHGERVDTTGFNLHAAKLILHGHVFDPSLTYHFQVNFGEGRVAAEDLYLRWRASSWLTLLVGQNEVVFNREHITLEAYQELIDRSSVDAHFNLQRDLGVMAYLSDPDHRFEATLGLYNGARANAANDDTGFLTTARLAYNPMGPIAFREADVDDSRRPKVSLAIAGAYNPERTVAAAPPATSATTLRHIAQGVAEVTFRYRGLSLTTEGHVRREARVPGPHVWDTGLFLQTGYFLVPRHFQLVGRVARLAGTLSTTDTLGEETFGMSYYVRGHRLKLQADGSHLETRLVHDGWRARVQLEWFL